jgi:hypothetical protein
MDVHMTLESTTWTIENTLYIRVKLVPVSWPSQLLEARLACPFNTYA